jgi:NitT/TauT family transport system permease protein
MGRSLGASRSEEVRKIVLPAALPEILAGVRLGLIRGVKGVIIGQLLIAIVGIGYLFERYSRGVLMAEFWALMIIVFAFAFALSEAVGFFERRVAAYAMSR